ncbi:MAG TPA: hypothetical protein VKM94_23435 [Blastocatellia bacterium]|nr:hypothetical protein [Blastocatellia bacterium]
MCKTFLVVLAISTTLVAPVAPKSRPETAALPKGGIRSVAIWRQPSNIKTRDLFYGPGGKALQPKAPFRFIKEDREGSSPKFVIKDARGVQWKVKLGEEAAPETVATRFLWAVGYFTDVDYYRSALRVEGLPKLERGNKYVSPDNTVHGARLERAGKKKLNDWSWFDNSFVGTREFDGLRVMMALVNNWDLKNENNSIYRVNGNQLRYVVSDLGATFGRTGGGWDRSKGKVEDYRESKFISKVKPKYVDFVLHSRPPVPYAVAVPYYVNRTHMEKVGEHIPRENARWIGQLLGKLSSRQIKDAFRAGGYTNENADAYAFTVRDRIRQLNQL